MGREGEVVERLLPEFERRHPELRVRLQQIPWTAAHAKLLTAFAGDTLPDLCQLGNTWVPELVALGALENLDRRVAASSVVAPDDYFPGVWDTNVIDGHLYGIPWYVDTRLLFYRSDLLAQAGFDAPPHSWAEWQQALAAIKAQGGPDRHAILYLFHARYGVVNYWLGSVGVPPVDWLGDPHWAMPTIILLAVWKNFGYNMVIILAGLQAIPGDLYEAARIDGASWWRQIVGITLPMLAPTLTMVGILTTAGYFQLFAEPYVMIQGGPVRSTVSVAYFMYEEGFKWWNFGAASAVAFLLFGLIFAVTALLVRFGNRGANP